MFHSSKTWFYLDLNIVLKYYLFIPSEKQIRTKIFASNHFQFVKSCTHYGRSANVFTALLINLNSFPAPLFRMAVQTKYWKCFPNCRPHFHQYFLKFGKLIDDLQLKPVGILKQTFFDWCNKVIWLPSNWLDNYSSSVAIRTTKSRKLRNLLDFEIMSHPQRLQRTQCSVFIDCIGNIS